MQIFYSLALIIERRFKFYITYGLPLLTLLYLWGHYFKTAFFSEDFDFSDTRRTVPHALIGPSSKAEKFASSFRHEYGWFLNKRGSLIFQQKVIPTKQTMKAVIWY